MAPAGVRGRGLARLAVQQQLRAVHGIKVKSRAAKGKPLGPAAAAGGGGKIFGIALHTLPHQVVPEYGSIPCFLVEVCKYLEEYLHTEGLFRKSGSFVRLKTLKSKLDQGENCLSTAQPCDVAGLLKQFFRELPEPVLPSDLHEALIKAQQLGPEERDSATLLLSCLMSDGTIETLRYFFKFLQKVSLRSTENKMNSSNLAVIFAPNLFQLSEADKISTQIDKKLHLQAAVVQTLVDHAEDIGNVPKYILDKVPAMLGIDDPVCTPLPQDYDESEGETPGERKRRRRRSLGDIVSGALNKLKSNRTPSTTPQRDRSECMALNYHLQRKMKRFWKGWKRRFVVKRRVVTSFTVFPSVTPVLVTPSTKRKYPADSVQGFSNKKRRSLRHNLALELLPSSVFNISSTPASAQFETSPCVSLEASQSLLSTSIPSEKQSLGSRRSKRIASKKVQRYLDFDLECQSFRTNALSLFLYPFRVESGKMGCFSPKISRKEMVRRSLRLKFILGKNSKENPAVEHPAVNRSETIGRRLASQTDLENGVTLVQTVALLSPHAGKTITEKGSKNSKSEENLQMANYPDEASYRISWTGCCTTESQETYRSGTNLMANLDRATCSSEPALTTRKPAVMPAKYRPVDGSTGLNSKTQQTSFCEDESNSTTDTLLKIKRAFSESGSNLHNLLETEPSKSNLAQETACISVLGLEPQLSEAAAQKVTVVEQETLCTSSATTHSVIDKHPSNLDHISSMDASLFPSTSNSLILELSGSDELEGQLPVVPSPGVHEGSTEALEWNLRLAPEKIIEDKQLTSCNSERETKEILDTRELLSTLQKEEDGNSNQYLHMKPQEKSKSSPSGKVADHIHWFNKLSLNEPCSATKTKPPLKFQRTPVRQSVRRMNSLLEASKQSAACKLIKPGDGCLSRDTSASCETGLSYAESVSGTATMSYDQLAQSSISYPQSIYPLEQAGRPGTTCKVKSITASQSKSVLEDRTNHETSKMAKMNTGLNISTATPDRCAVRKLLVEKKTRYRGSPKNPIATAQLLPAIKPLDF
ncbi:hypothetical protein lerEdw1_017331 [Lerista edwardsae]|nr:hypothetical protein lerEdw1_017331 [Lerista edwardsae]